MPGIDASTIRSMICLVGLSVVWELPADNGYSGFCGLQILVQLGLCHGGRSHHLFGVKVRR